VSYRNRLRKAVYVSPSGIEHAFEFFELERTNTKKVAEKELPQRDQADIQDLGNATLVIPITAYLTGSDYDKSADTFFKALSERGPGVLRHPRWGNIPALPVSTRQYESFVDNSRRATFDIEFHRVTPIAYPTSAAQVEAGVSAAADTLATESAASWAEAVDTTDAAKKAEAKATFLSGLKSFTRNVQGIASSVSELAQKISSEVSRIESGIDTLLDAPQTLAISLINLYRMPARVAVSAAIKVQSYKRLGEYLIDNALEVGSLDEAISYLFQAKGAIAAMGVSTLNGALDRRDQAIAVADTLATSYAALIEAIEEKEGANYSETQSEMLALDEIITESHALVLNRSFSLKVARRVELDEDATPFELASRFYPKVDPDMALDTVIEENSLQDSEILMCPRGKEMVYYA